jgi:hypothetical protein
MLFRKIFRKSERGQGIAEYTIIFPPVLLLTILITIGISDRIGDVYCEMVNAIQPDSCVIAEAAEPEEEEEVCIPLQQDEGGSQCDQSDECDLLPGLNNGSYTSTSDIDTFVLKAGRDYHMYFSGITDDGCYYVDIEGSHVSWNKVGSGPDCKDVSHAQSWNHILCD